MVCEVAEAYQWWDRGEMEHWLDYQPISGMMRDSIGVLKAAIGDVESAMLAPKGS